MAWILFAAAAVCAAAGPVFADDAAALRLESFETIWRTVNEHHFDPDFGGVDWSAIRDTYRARVERAESDEAFLTLANDMLAELGLSHYAVFRVDGEERKSKTPSGTSGLTVRLLGDEAVVTAARDGFPAAAAGVRPGWTVDAVDGAPVDSLLAEGDRRARPGEDARRRRLNGERAVARALLGDAGSEMTIDLRDGEGDPRRVRLNLAERPGRTILDETLPPFFIEFESRRLAGNIAYVAFSTFLPPVDERFAAAIDGMQDARGLIIDIRGNPGGMHTVGEAIAARLLPERTLFSVFRHRDGTEEVFVEPEGVVFAGPVAVLIDARNASASERFSGCLQAVGRAVVIGERSRGSVGPSDAIRLPDGATLLYLLAQSLTPDGRVLEGHGVEPDFTVTHERKALLAGRDLQLERAIAYIENGR